MRWIPLLLCVTACTPYIQAEMALVAQARKGVALLAESQAAHRELAEAYHESRRRQLDQAFDDDVRGRGEFSADWIIDHRKAYAAGLDALALQRQASIEAHRAAQSNLRATDAALQRLEYLQSVRLDVVQSLSPK
jgi:hypothetical protein